LLECVLTVLHFGMIGGYTKTDETVGHRQLLIHVDDGILDLVHKAVRRVEPRGTRADDGNAEGFT
jgi:hypothetical protein